MIQLRIRTEYSFGQTFATIPRIITRLKEMGCTAAGIVDIDSTYGHVEWHKRCTEAGIKPLLGVDLAVECNGIKQRMWFLARNSDGLKELYNLASASYAQGALYRADIEKISNGIFIFSGEVTDEDFLQANYIFHDLSPASIVSNLIKKRIAKKTAAPLFSVSDNSYIYESDKSLFEVISKAGSKTTQQHIIELKDGNPESHVRDSATVGLESAPMIKHDGDIEQLCRDGIKERAMTWNDEYETRLKYELDLIKSKDFESYFLIVADMTRYAKNHMLVGPSRGSASGSLVCYLMRITEIDPVANELFFERFIDVSRKDLPDIDLDFPDNKREMVWQYMREKYGDDRIAHIGTVSRFKARSALVTACKAMRIPSQATGAVKVSIIDRPASDPRALMCLQDTFEQTEAGKDFIEAYPHAIAAAEIEGHASHTGVHAAGLLICNDKISDYCSVDRNGIAQIDKYDAEKLGLLKIDILGLRTLSILEDSGVKIDWYNLPLDDKKTFDLFNSGKFCGIFQFDGNAMRSVSKRIKFESIADIDAVTALARPGTMAGGVTEKYIKRKNGESYEPLHPLVEKHMKETYGLPIYQEQTLAIVRDIGGFGWEDAGAIRKAVSKSLGDDFFEGYWLKFKAGAKERGLDEREARAIWDLIKTMGAWQMNRAHTFSYAVISFWTAYLKANHPLEFAAATLRNAKDEDSAVSLLRELHEDGLQFVHFDIEKSVMNWSVCDGKLLGGFTSLKGIGEKKAKKIIEARDSDTLTEKQKETIKKAPNVYENIFPIFTKYAAYYDDPQSMGVLDKVCKIKDLEDIAHKHERVFIAQVTYISLRDMNEDVLIKKRKGKIETGQLSFVDLRFKDDSGEIGGRVSKWDFERVGSDMLESVKDGDMILVRASFFNSIRYAFVKKWRLLK